jgi:hypothetical protein
LAVKACPSHLKWAGVRAAGWWVLAAQHCSIPPQGLNEALVATPAPARLQEDPMKLDGGCYCGKVRYVAEGEPMMQAQCHCRECQYITGGAPNLFLAMPVAGFRYTKDMPKAFKRSDLERPVTREFCAECGTHLATRPQGFPAVIVKVGTLDDPNQFGAPKLAIYTVDKQAFHHIPDGLPTFERLPNR